MTDHPTTDRHIRPTNPFIAFRPEELEQSMPARFEHQVLRDPGKRAVKSRSEAVTYADLDQIANRVAWAIIDRLGGSIGQEPVVLLLDRGVMSIAAMLGVFTAGKILTVLDPAAPSSRLIQIVNNAQPALIATDRVNHPLARELAEGRPILDLDSERHLDSEASPNLAIPPDAPAYIIYTSGSTGQPKGVLHSHRNLLHDCMSRINLFHISAQDRWTLFAFATSQAIKNTFVALLSGGTLYPWDVRREGVEALPRWLIEERITIMNTSASLFRELVGTLSGVERFSDLRLIRLGSEKMVPRDLEGFRRSFAPDCALVNMLSSNEVGGICCAVMDGESTLQADLVPVGWPMPDQELQLVDEDGNPVGSGEVGEIVVQSRYLSLGY